LPPTDYIREAIRHSREDFARNHCHFFLIGPSTLTPPRKPSQTGAVPILWLEDEEKTCLGEADPPPRSLAPLIFPVRKIQRDFPSMITIGRTANNDIVLSDSQVSRFHAYFRVGADHLELGDAGSVNGTFVDEMPLPAKGPTFVVASGARLRFAHHDFLFIDAASAWIRLRATRP
jgi:hypothetical protein